MKKRMMSILLLATMVTGLIAGCGSTKKEAKNDDDVVTDQPERQIVAELIREKVLRLMDAEVPHGIAVSVESMKMRRQGHMMDIHATIVCERESHKGMIIGKQGRMLRQIGQNARYEIENLLDTKVNLQLWVKVKKDWRDSDFLIKNFGYDKNDY